MLKDKYNMTKEQNIFLAKRNIVDNIWKSAMLEGIDVTFPETQTLYDGGNVARLGIDQIQIINNLKHAWKFILLGVEDKIDLNYICSVNSLVGSNVIDEPGKMRVYDVQIGGTEWQPELPTEGKIDGILTEFNKNENNTDSIVTLMCKLMKLQFFSDGNKRTAMLIANHELIKNGRGIIAIGENVKTEFGEKLIKYYEADEKIEDLKQFIYDKCLTRNRKIKDMI